MTKVIETEVRGVTMRLTGSTRALELCARMNRENEVLDFIDQMDEASVLYDLGACEGRFAIYAALRNIRCYAFEPEALNYDTLLKNIELNGEPARRLVVPFPHAVGARTEESSLRIGQPWAGGHWRVLDNAPGRVDLNFASVASQAVQVVALDSFIRDRGLPLPNYLKVDIDGSELPFCEGAPEVLRSKDLKGIVIELCEQDPSYATVMSLLRDYGFAACGSYEIEPGLANIVLERR